jgi:WD40 repeat protein
LAAGARDRSDACDAIYKRHAPGGGSSAPAAKEMIREVAQPFITLLAEQDETYHWGELAAVWNVAERQQRAFVKQPLMNESDFARIDAGSSNAIPRIQQLMREPIEPADISPHRMPPLLLADSHLVWFDRQQGVMRMDLATGETEAIVAPQAIGIAWGLSPDGGTLLVKSAQPGKLLDCRGDFLDLESKALRGPFTTDTGRRTDRDDACRFSPDGGLVAVAVDSENDVALKLLDAATGEERPLEIPVEWDVAALTFSADGSLLAFIDGDPKASADVSFGQLRLIDVATGQERPTLIKDTVYSLAFSPDGQTLAAVSGGGTTALLLDVESGQVREAIDDFTSRITAVAFSPDSRLLVVAGGAIDSDYYPAPAYEEEAVQAELKIFSAAGGKLLLALAGHRHLITSAAFSPDGHTLATGSWDRTVRLWDCTAAGE